MEGPIRVLIVEDSTFTRKALGLMLKSAPDIEIAGEARDGQEAVLKAAELRPDVVTMDLEMPRLDGTSAIAELRRRGLRMPVLVVSSLAAEGAEAALKALAAGAADCLAKPDGSGGLDLESMEKDLLDKVRHLSGRTAPQVPEGMLPGHPGVISKAPARILVVGSSTGGVEALTSLLSPLPSTFPIPVVVAQHIPEVFSPMLAQRLNRICPLGATEVREEAGLFGKKGIFVIQGQKDGRIVGNEAGFSLAVGRHGAGSPAAPSVDLLFESAARALGPRHVLAVVLTGMGEDGARGALRIHQGGGRVYAQDRSSSVVWGMPGAVARAGAADAVLPLDELGAAVMETVP